jgi:LAO/AO transport system kinase
LSGERLSGTELAAALREHDLAVAPAVLNLLESVDEEDREQAAELEAALSPRALGGEAEGHIIGFTGSPGVGKSTLLGALVAVWRPARTVAVLAVDPSSKRSGGALLGDRLRIAGSGVGGEGRFIRSMAARERSGGLAPATRAAAQVLAVAFDLVVVETVGVGQSETAIGNVADTVVVVVQPGAGDALQFLKAGLLEIPDLIVVAKADLGAPARATLQDARAALRAVGLDGDGALAVSALAPTSGIEELAAALDAHRAALDLGARRAENRRGGALEDFVSEFGERGLRAVGGRREAELLLAGESADRDGAALIEVLARRAAGSDGG